MKQFALILAISILSQTIWAQNNVEEVYEIFSKAYATYDSELIKKIYNEEAIYLSPGQPIEAGSDIILNGFRSMFDGAREKEEKLNIAFKIVDRNTQGEVVIDIGYYKLTRTSKENESRTFVGKFITVLKQAEDGNWQFIADGYSNAPVSAYPD